MGEDETKGKGSVDDDGFLMDDDCHLEWDRVEDNDEKNGDENVGAEEQGKQRYGSNPVAEKKSSYSLTIPTIWFQPNWASLSQSSPLPLCEMSPIPDSDSIKWNSNSKPPLSQRWKKREI